jgi:uncharacterized protein GlcG (DUF336 family)
MDESGTKTSQSALNRRQALGLAGVTVGAVGATAMAAPAAAAGVDGGGGGGAVPLHSVSAAQARAVLEAAIAYIRANDLRPMFVVVVDVCGDEKASVRMDGNGAASVELAPVKARTSAAFRTPTATLASNTTEPGAIASFTSAGFSLLGGGHPLTHEGMVIGAVGVGGGTPQEDARVAEAAAAALA